MHIKKLKLQDFRNFGKSEFDFSEHTTVIVGPNAAGKTNILEAINFLATGKSFKAAVQEEVVNYEKDIARIKGITIITRTSGTGENLPVINHQSQITNLEAVLTRGEIEIAEGKSQKAPKKRLFVNGVAKRLMDFSGILKTVLFGPWDMDLVTESPSIRRRFLDNVLSLVNREYRRSLMSYEKGVRQRNRLLYRIREEGLPRSQLMFWNQLLIKNGNYITEKRGEFIDFVNRTRDFPATEIIAKIYGGKKLDFNLNYDESVISEGRLEKYKNEEVAAATTLVGPHRDDFIFELRNKGTEDLKNVRELARFGSRGEQRMGVLWLKMAELGFIEEISGEKPALLLDDIYSELDHEHREIVMNMLTGKNNGKNSKIGQVIITTADEHLIAGLKGDKIKVINL